MAVTSSVYSEEQTRSMGIDEEERSLADGNRQRSIHVHSGSFDFQDSRFSSGIGSPRDSVERPHVEEVLYRAVSLLGKTVSFFILSTRFYTRCY